ncbi:type I-D CRISPR-associated helicase Cas3' [Nostoc sp.]|uniref:type I-D CRISPR-associated helicase Cas3' n=1 Tax=Nostoc sp. TaxID=1180 RepID=UPI002FF7AFF7
MKLSILPLYSQLNPGIGACPLGCTQICKVKQQAPNFAPDSHCPLSSHQAQTYAEIISGTAEVIFNTSATGDGKSLAAYLVALLNPGFRIIGLYPTIELVTDQEKQVIGYYKKFQPEGITSVDTFYGAELARRIEESNKSNKFKELLLSFKQKHVILTNPDIFHLVAHFRYYNPAYNRGVELPLTLARNPDLYVADEFHIFGVHQEAAILNAMLLIRHNRPRKRPMRFLFTTATPKPEFIKMLKTSGFKVAEVGGNYVSQSTPGFRQISQPVNLEFVQLDQDTDSLTWLIQQAETIRAILQAEGSDFSRDLENLSPARREALNSPHSLVGKGAGGLGFALVFPHSVKSQAEGRGLIILNSVALVSRAVRQLQALLPDVIVREISGRIDRQERALAQQDLQNSLQPVLIIGTSAVDVGVDFKIHLLIFETSDSATFMQRLGRLGRHPGFLSYKAFVLLPSRTPWIMARLKEKLEDGQTISRIKSQKEELDLTEIIAEAFDPPKKFEQYRSYWGALQAQGMLFSMSPKKKDEVMQQLKDSMAEDLRHVYGEQLDKKRGHWYALGQDKTKTGEAIQQELLRFRGGSDLQASVWDEGRFYTYNLLRLLPYAEVEVINREGFLEAAKQANHSATEFPEKYIQVYLRIRQWSDERFPIALVCDRGTDELKQSTLSLIDKLSIIGHPQAEVSRCLGKQKLLTFLVQVNRSQPNSHWDISRALHLSPTFGLYRLQDADEQYHACAFNQDALLLEALKWRIPRCDRTKPYTF